MFKIVLLNWEIKRLNVFSPLIMILYPLGTVLEYLKCDINAFLKNSKKSLVFTHHNIDPVASIAVKYHCAEFRIPAYGHLKLFYALKYQNIQP